MYSAVRGAGPARVDPFGLKACSPSVLFVVGSHGGYKLDADYGLNPGTPGEPNDVPGTVFPSGGCGETEQCSWTGYRIRFKVKRQNENGDYVSCTCPPDGADAGNTACCNEWHEPPAGNAPQGAGWGQTDAGGFTTRFPGNPNSPPQGQSEWGVYSGPGLGSFSVGCPGSKISCATVTSYSARGVPSISLTSCFVFSCAECPQHVTRHMDPIPSDEAPEPDSPSTGDTPPDTRPGPSTTGGTGYFP